MNPTVFDMRHSPVVAQRTPFDRKNGQRKGRGVKPARSTQRSLGKNQLKAANQRKTQVATKVLLIVDLRSKTMKKCNKERKI